MLNFPQHLPTHILDEDDSDDSSSINDGSGYSDKLNKNKEIETQIASETPNHGPSTIIKTEIPENVLSRSCNSNDDSGNLGHANNNDIDSNEPSEHQTSSNDKLRIITANPIIIDNKITVESASNVTLHKGYGDEEDVIDNNGEEHGYYEKTIINKNGVFIENIRKIANIDEDQRKVFITTPADRDNGQQKKPPQAIETDESINRRNIALVSVPLSQHYVITSSGKIEKTDPLANDDVIEQFRDGLLNDYQRQPLLHHITTTDNSAGGIINATESGISDSGSMATVTISAITASFGGGNDGTVSSAGTAAAGGGGAGENMDDNGGGNGARSDDVKQFKCIVMGKCRILFSILYFKITICSYVFKFIIVNYAGVVCRIAITITILYKLKYIIFNTMTIRVFV